MGLFGTDKPTLVVDGDTVLKSRGIRGNAAPRQQLQLLRMLSRTGEREGLQITAVLTGKPLDKAPNNRKTDGVRVHYTGKNTDLAKDLFKAWKRAGSGGVAVTDDVELEQRVQRAGGATLRVSTFRKLLEEGGDTPSNGGHDKKRSRSKGRRSNRRRDGNNSSKPAQKKQPEKKKEPNRDDAISQMIDLVE